MATTITLMSTIVGAIVAFVSLPLHQAIAAILFALATILIIRASQRPPSASSGRLRCAAWVGSAVLVAMGLCAMAMPMWSRPQKQPPSPEPTAPPTTVVTSVVPSLTLTTGMVTQAVPPPPTSHTGSTGPTPQKPGPTRPVTGPVLLSSAKPAHASSYQDDDSCPSCTPDKAFDGDLDTRWATSALTGWGDYGWIYVDLERTATISQVVLRWESAYATKYKIQTSLDASDDSWKTIRSVGHGTGGVETLEVHSTGRYVRMYGTTRSTSYGYSLFEFQVYGT